MRREMWIGDTLILTLLAAMEFAQRCDIIYLETNRFSCNGFVFRVECGASPRTTFMDLIYSKAEKVFNC